MSCTLTLTGHTSVLSANYYPPIELDSKSSYGIGLLGFYTYNSIVNVDETNNCFVYRTLESPSQPIISHIPPGTYEVDEIHKAILKLLKIDTKEELDRMSIFSLRPNNNTLKCEIFSKYLIDFTQKNTLATLLGFENKLLQPNILHESTLPVDIMKTRIICVECDIVGGAYVNSEQSHGIFQFDIDVEPGYKLTKEPRNIVYMPIKPAGRRYIDCITLYILDDSGQLVDFRGEKIIIKLELKKLL